MNEDCYLHKASGAIGAMGDLGRQGIHCVCIPLGGMNGGAGESSGRGNGVSTAVVGGRFEIKGVLHTYDRQLQASLRTSSERDETAIPRTPNFARRMERRALIE
jgi:hypothetical protein